VPIPDGVLFNSSTAHKTLRKMLIDDNQLEAVISLPSGVFKPYAGVSTAVLVFTKGGRTDHIFFYDVQADGFSLDDKRQEIEENDLPNCLRCWRERDPRTHTDRTAQGFFVPADEVRQTNYELSVNRYKRSVYEEENYDPPKAILERMATLNRAIESDIADLEGLLS